MSLIYQKARYCADHSKDTGKELCKAYRAQIRFLDAIQVLQEKQYFIIFERNNRSCPSRSITLPIMGQREMASRLIALPFKLPSMLAPPVAVAPCSFHAGIIFAGPFTC